MNSRDGFRTKSAAILWTGALGLAFGLLAAGDSFVFSGHSQLPTLSSPSVESRRQSRHGLGLPRTLLFSKPTGPSGRTTGLTDELDHLELDLFDDAQWSKAPQSWPATLARLFVDLGPHDAATDFVLNAPMASSPQALIYQALCELPLNEFDLQALLYPAGSHLLTTEQLQKLLARTGPTSKLRVLDVGAGDGCITQNIRALGCTLVASETSMGMAMRLRMGGYEVWCEDIAVTANERVKSGESFSLVSVLNVLDRCASPQRLCTAVHKLVSDEGYLLLATPLPFVASYYGKETKWNGEPMEKILLSETQTWEEDAKVLLQDFLPSCGFQPIAVSRLPYLSGGDEEDGGCIELDDIVVLARKVDL